MRAALLVAAKDLRQRLRDRSVILISVLAPLGLAVVFSGLVSGVTDFHAKYSVADLDGGAIARAFREDVLGSLEQAGIATITDVDSSDAARAAVEDGDADAAFVIPAGFSNAVSYGATSTIDVFGGASSGLAVDIARSVVERFGDGVAGVQLAGETTAAVRGRPAP